MKNSYVKNNHEKLSIEKSLTPYLELSFNIIIIHYDLEFFINKDQLLLASSA